MLHNHKMYIRNLKLCELYQFLNNYIVTSILHQPLNGAILTLMIQFNNEVLQFT